MPNRWENEIERIYQSELRKAGDEISVAYADMLKEFQEEARNAVNDPDVLTRTGRYHRQRAEALRNRIQKKAREVNPEIRKAIKELGVKSGELGYYGTQYALEHAASTDLSMDTLNMRHLNTVITDKIDGKRFSQRLYEDRNKLANLVSREIQKGVVDGVGVQGLAKRLEQVTENDYKHSLLIARTESKRVRSETHQDALGEAVDAGLIIQEEWIHSGNTDNPRVNHEEMDGQRIAAGQNFVSPDGNEAKAPGLFGVPEEDIQCGCWVADHVVGNSNTDQEFESSRNWREWARKKDLEVNAELMGY